MILTLPPIQLPVTGEFERNPSFLLSFLYHRHRGPRYAIRTVLYPCTCTEHMYVRSSRTSLQCNFLQGGGDVVKRSDCILVYESTTKGGVVKRSDCILVYESTTKGDVVKRSNCILYLPICSH